MKPAAQPPDKKVGLSPVLFLIIFGIIIVAILAFLILRPNPRNSSLLLPADTHHDEMNNYSMELLPIRYDHIFSSNPSYTTTATPSTAF